MSIRIDHASALQQQEEARRKQKAAEGFDSLLSESLTGGEAQGVATGAGLSRAVLQGLETLREFGRSEEVSTGSGLEADTAERLDGVMDGFDEYARELTRESGPNLKSAFVLLQRMSGQIADMRAAFPEMAEQSPELAAMVNELEVMATAETFKLNRGDYL